MPEQNTPTPIRREDIRKGDRIRRIDEFTAKFELGAHESSPFTYELVSRPVMLPTEPGYYVGTALSATPVWQLGIEGAWYYIGNEYRPIYGGSTAGDPTEHMPLTILRVVSEGTAANYGVTS